MSTKRVVHPPRPFSPIATLRPSKGERGVIASPNTRRLAIVVFTWGPAPIGLLSTHGWQTKNDLLGTFRVDWLFEALDVAEGQRHWQILEHESERLAVVGSVDEGCEYAVEVPLVPRHADEIKVGDHIQTGEFNEQVTAVLQRGTKIRIIAGGRYVDWPKDDVLNVADLSPPEDARVTK
jgi:hypothetical protein